MSNNNDDFTPPKNPNFLKLQLERSRFMRALEIAESLIEHGSFLNSTELARINNVIRGETIEPWRDGPTVCALPSGRHEKFDILADPVKLARDLLTHAKDRAANGEVIEAAADLYADLVINHVFKDANRRTAVVAVSYLLKLYGYEVSASGLHDLGLGDLRAPGQKEALRELVRHIVKLKSAK